MPLLGDTEVSNLSLDEIEAEVIVKEYFNYIGDIGLSLEFDLSKNYEKTDKLDIVDIMEGISRRLESNSALIN